MSVLRNHPKGARFASFGIGLCIFALMPRETGYQDIASLLARQPGVAERWQKQVFSAASSIQLATYSFSRPIGTSAPQSAMVRLASLDGRDVTGSITHNPVLQAPPRYQASDFPKVDRSMKGDRLATVTPAPASETPAPPARQDPATSNSSVFGAKTAAVAASHVAGIRGCARSRAPGGTPRAAVAAICQSAEGRRQRAVLCGPAAHRARSRPRSPRRHAIPSA